MKVPFYRCSETMLLLLLDIGRTAVLFDFLSGALPQGIYKMLPFHYDSEEIWEKSTSEDLRKRKKRDGR